MNAAATIHLLRRLLKGEPVKVPRMTLDELEELASQDDALSGMLDAAEPALILEQVLQGTEEPFVDFGLERESAIEHAVRELVDDDIALDPASFGVARFTGAKGLRVYDKLEESLRWTPLREYSEQEIFGAIQCVSRSIYLAAGDDESAGDRWYWTPSGVATQPAAHATTLQQVISIGKQCRWLLETQDLVADLRSSLERHLEDDAALKMLTWIRRKAGDRPRLLSRYRSAAAEKDALLLVSEENSADILDRWRETQAPSRSIAMDVVWLPHEQKMLLGPTQAFAVLSIPTNMQAKRISVRINTNTYEMLAANSVSVEVPSGQESSELLRFDVVSGFEASSTRFSLQLSSTCAPRTLHVDLTAAGSLVPGGSWQ